MKNRDRSAALKTRPALAQRSLFDPAPDDATSREPASPMLEVAATGAGLPRPASGRYGLFAEDDPFAVPPAAKPAAPPARIIPCRENAWIGIEELEELKSRVLSCSSCPLRGGARGVVFGEGDPRASIMFVGEGPGQTEDQTGRPFVGRAGQLLDTTLRAIGFRRDQVFIANIVKCRPPGNRLPMPPEVAVCLPHLRAQIRIVDPKIIVLLGALSGQTLLNPAIRVTRDRGKWFEIEGRSYLCTFHPAAVLRDERGKKGLLLEDFESVKIRWERLGDDAVRNTD